MPFQGLYLPAAQQMSLTFCFTSFYTTAHLQLLTNSSRYVFTKVTDLFDHLLQNTSLLYTAHYRQLVSPNAWNGQPLTSLCMSCLIIMIGQLLYHSSVLPLIPPTKTQLATRLSTFYSTANHHVFWHSFFKKIKLHSRVHQRFCISLPLKCDHCQLGSNLRP